MVLIFTRLLFKTELFLKEKNVSLCFFDVFKTLFLKYKINFRKNNKYTNKSSSKTTNKLRMFQIFNHRIFSYILLLFLAPSWQKGRKNARQTEKKRERDSEKREGEIEREGERKIQRGHRPKERRRRNRETES